YWNDISRGKNFCFHEIIWFHIIETKPNGFIFDPTGRVWNGPSTKIAGDTPDGDPECLHRPVVEGRFHFGGHRRLVHAQRFSTGGGRHLHIADALRPV